MDRVLLRLVSISLTCFDSLNTPVATQCIGCRVEHTFTLPLWYQVWESASDQYPRRATCFIYLRLKQIPFAAAAVILVLHPYIVLFVPPFLQWFIYVRDWEGWQKYKDENLESRIECCFVYGCILIHFRLVKNVKYCMSLGEEVNVDIYSTAHICVDFTHFP